MNHIESNVNMTPRYEHDCANCTYLGAYKGNDLYHCLQNGDFATLIVRIGDEPWANVSGLVFAEFGEPAFVEAYNRAAERGLKLKRD